MSARTTRAGSVLLAVGLLLAGCGDGDSSPATEPGATTEATPEAWNPCDGLDAARVGRLLGQTLAADYGMPGAPRCALVPRTEGEAIIDANYVVFPEGLDAAWEQMGAPDDGTVTEPEIPGADDARLVADAGEAALGVTGFVQNGALVQVVNLLDTAPYDEKAAVAATRDVMTQLSAYAAQDGAPQ